MKPIEEITSKDLEEIKLVVFDVDGVLVPRGTKIKQNGYITTLETKVIADKQIKQLRKFKGFEPKELIITIHCEDEISKIPYLVDEHNKSIKSTGQELYCLWNGEAYDIGVKDIQTKAVGLINLIKYLGLEKKNSLAIGDNLNDAELLAQAGISVTADKERVKGDFYVPLFGEKLPADFLIDCILANKISKI